MSSNDPRRAKIRDAIGSAPDEGRTVREIAQLTGIPKSTVGWLLRMMVEAGEVRDGEGRHKGYRLAT